MAITNLVPVIERSRKIAIKKSNEVALKILPGFGDGSQERASNRVFYSLIGAILGSALIALLGINIALSNDAVRIRELKLEVIAISEAREQSLREVTNLSTPANLAKSAKELGMVPSREPVFIDLSPTRNESDR